MSATEMLVIAVIILIAVGPRKLPVLMRSVGRGMREVRRATRELRAQVGLDELDRELDEHVREPLSELRRAMREPLEAVTSPDGAPPAPIAEYPDEGVDLSEAERASATGAPKDVA